MGPSYAGIDPQIRHRERMDIASEAVLLDPEQGVLLGYNARDEGDLLDGRADAVDTGPVDAGPVDTRPT